MHSVTANGRVRISIQVIGGGERQEGKRGRRRREAGAGERQEGERGRREREAGGGER